MNRFNQILVAGILLLIPLRAMQAMDTNSPAGHGAFQPGPEDPFLWLEDIHGARAMEWVKAQNAKATDRLQADADYRTDYDAILKVLDATDRIPFGNLDHNFVFNFWQDAGHSKGIWRRTTIADYTNGSPTGKRCSTLTSWRRTRKRTGFGRVRIARRPSGIA